MHPRWMILLVAILLTACARSTDPLPAGPGAGEMTTGPVFVDTTDLLLRESFPVQVDLRVQGALPTPCHHAIWSIAGPTTEGRLEVELHSEAPAEPACIQVLEDLDLTIPLGSYAEADFTVFLNGQEVGPVHLP
jgi:hypothetical protein